EGLVADLEGIGLVCEEDRALGRGWGGRTGLEFSLASRPESVEFRRMWLSFPGRATARTGDAQRLAEEVLEAVAPMVAEAVGEDEDKERKARAERRAELALLTSGLEILASWYTDSATLQHGGPIRNTDVPLSELTDVSPAKAVANAELVLDAAVDLSLNLSRQLPLDKLFAHLA